MKKISQLLSAIVIGAASLALAAGNKTVSVGAVAPEFSAVDSTGHKVNLEAYRGKYVVLEWCNFGCPYVQKHYKTGNMQDLQKKYTDKGVVWLTIFSSSEGQQGFYTNDQLNKFAASKKMSSKLVADPEGAIGHEYNAQNTPTMFVINPKGNVIYMGGIDDQPTSELDSVKGAKNYVSAALDEAMAGKSVTTPKARPYGCSIKYKD